MGEVRAGQMERRDEWWGTSDEPSDGERGVRRGKGKGNERKSREGCGAAAADLDLGRGAAREWGRLTQKSRDRIRAGTAERSYRQSTYGGMSECAMEISR
jgi:hypothetical protein